ncbi:hypothetical protein QYF36_027005 [Acer negundo]|nr:hypothetical protein QYF36_027005 [Acer negundo]
MADLANEQSHTSEHVVTMVEKGNEPTCWGCGLHLLLPSYTPTFKCGWCGAITGQHVRKYESKCFRWRRLRDHCFVCFLLVFMFFVIGGGIWAMHPVVFSISSLSGIFHSIIAILLAISTVSTFSLASFRCAGTQPNILWGSYPLVGKGDLVNYTFCHYCTKPKSPRTHHCRTCGVCVLDMDHHCPFIGNCVGAGNHRHFIAFLISAVVSTIYVSIMCANVGLRTWPPFTLRSHFDRNGHGSYFAMRILKEMIHAFLNSAVLMSFRGVLLLYLFISTISVNFGLSVLLWQQLYYIYEGKTYLNHLKSEGSDMPGKRDCENIIHFFGFPYSASRYLPTIGKFQKKHTK